MGKQTGTDLDKKLETNSKKETTKMKKLSINPQVKGAFKTLFVIVTLAVVFYAGAQYQEQYHQKVTTEAVQIVAQLKANAQ